MQTLIVIVIVASAIAYLIWRMFTKSPGAGCGCSCTSCHPKKSACTETKNNPGKQN